MFNLNFSWKSIQLNSVVLPKLNEVTEDFQKNSLVYRFTCNCSVTYIGETKRRLATRMAEHGRPSCDTEIYRHIVSCSIYKTKFIEFDPGGKPGPQKRKAFLQQHFSILQKNLHNYYDRVISEAHLIKLFRSVPKPR